MVLYMESTVPGGIKEKLLDGVWYQTDVDVLRTQKQ